MDRGKGSEHRIDGKQYDMELQFMFTTEGPSQEIPYWFTLRYKQIKRHLLTNLMLNDCWTDWNCAFDSFFSFQSAI